MRDLIDHHYYKLDAAIVRATIGDPLHRLRGPCEALIADGADSVRGPSERSGFGV